MRIRSKKVHVLSLLSFLEETNDPVMTLNSFVTWPRRIKNHGDHWRPFIVPASRRCWAQVFQFPTAGDNESSVIAAREPKDLTPVNFFSEQVKLYYFNNLHTSFDI